jgi:hypothetical protein
LPDGVLAAAKFSGSSLASITGMGIPDVRSVMYRVVVLKQISAAHLAGPGAVK